MTGASKENQPARSSDSAEKESASELIRCVECGQQVERRLSKDGEFCFHCAVHAACACADPTS